MEQHGTATEPDGQAAALRLSGLHKQFGETTAVDHLDLAVPRGSFVGLVVCWAETIRRRAPEP